MFALLGLGVGGNHVRWVVKVVISMSFVIEGIPFLYLRKVILAETLILLTYRISYSVKKDLYLGNRLKKHNQD